MGEAEAEGDRRPYYVELYRLDEDGLLNMITMARLEDRDGRLAVTRLIIDAEIDSAVLRSIPLSRIEASANRHFRGEFGEPRWERREWDPRGFVQVIRDPIPELVRADTYVEKYIRSTVAPPALADAFTPNKNDRPQRQPLTRPDGTDPDGFSRRVAEAYNAVVMLTHRPATLLAEEAGVPVTTVHRWIRDARQRGYLSPAKRGRAG